MMLRTRVRRPPAARLIGTSPAARICVVRLEERVLPAVNIAVNAAMNQHAISPLIYGLAFGTTAQLQGLNATLNRSGGNNESTYNWQTNALNLDSDYYFESYPQDGSGPAGASNDFITSTLAGGAMPTITVPTIGYVAKLGSGGSILPSFPASVYPNQQSFDPYDSNAGNGVYTNGQNITGNNPNLAYVASSPATEKGWIQEIVNTFGGANNGGVQYYTLDNEPSIWFQTHRDIAPTGLSMAGELNDIITYSAMIKSVDPNAQTVGPEEYGWTGYFYSGEDQQIGDATGNWTDLPDQTANGGWYYLPWVLNQLHIYDQAHGTQSLNVFSLHYYPSEGNVGSDDVSQATELLRNQSTRALWDPTYVDPSWIGTAGINNGIIQLIPMMQNWVNTYYPGLKTDISEYDFGADGDMNGATTEADALGIFGRQGLNMATRWTTPTNFPPAYMAMQMYRNYDGHDDTFGQTSVQDTVPNPDQVSSFASLRADGAMTIMVINKNLYTSSNPGATTPITLNLSSFAHGSSAQLWQLAAINPSDQTNAAISHLANVNFSGNSLSFNAPMESVSLFVISPASTTTGLTSSANPAGFADPVTFTATVGAGGVTPTGIVSFMDGTTLLGTANLSAGVGTYTTSALALGSHSITAVYGGATGFAGSTSAVVSETVVAPPAISSVQVNDGSAQRSEVRSITVTFSEEVTFAGSGTVNQDAAAAIELTHVQDNTNINNVAAAVSTNNSAETVVTLTFTTAGNAATEIDRVSAENGGAASLADGRYQMTILGSSVSAGGLALNGGGANGNYVSPNDTQGGGPGQLELYRIFGDTNGDGVVDQVDLAQFRSAFNASAGNPLYLSILDADNSGTIDQLDLAQFRQRFNGSVFAQPPRLTPASAPPPPSAPPLALAPAPTLEGSVQANDGSAQRSEVRSITVAVFGPVTDPFSGENGAALSLADGRYQLNILGGSVTGANGLALDGAANGTAGSNYVSPTDTQGGGPGQLHLYQLFGDAYGTEAVDQTDLSLFRSMLIASSDDAANLSYMDADNSGTVDLVDLSRFRSRFNSSIF